MEMSQWGYMNPETYVAKPKQVKGLGMLETKSDEETSESGVFTNKQLSQLT